ncbi:hypothetical protein IAU59_003102 [Kwoniella sp. CBS 9459]
MAVIHRTRTPVGGVQSILIVLFLVVVMYLFLSGGRAKGKSSASSAPTYSAEREDGANERKHAELARRERGKDRGREKGEKSGESGERDRPRSRDKRKDSKHTRSKLSDSSASALGTDTGPSRSKGSKEDARKKRSKKEEERKKRKRLEERDKKPPKTDDKKKKSKKEAAGAEPADIDPADLWEQPPSGSTPPLSPVPNHRTASPTRGIFRRRNSNDELPKSANVESNNRIKWTDLEGHSNDVVTKHFRKWGEHTGLRNDSGQPFTHRPPKPESGPKGIKENPIRYSIASLSSNATLKIPSELLELLKQAEQIGKANRADAQLWQAALQDSWDEQLGPVPRIAQEVAMQMARFVTKEDVRLLHAAMAERQKSDAKFDKARDFAKFQKSLGVKPEQNSTTYKYRLILAWYLETLRAKKYIERMQVHDEPVKMASHETLGKFAQMLGWMEYLATLNKRQRIFIGLDLAGLTMRAQAMKENGGYRLDLTVFLPGGPVQGDMDPEADWYFRCLDSAQAFRNFRVEIAQLFDNTAIDGNYKNPFTRRRLIFRPGWTVHGVNQENLGNNLADKSVAQRSVITRPPNLLELPEDIMSRASRFLRGASDSVLIKKLIAQLGPGEVSWLHLRQYQWDTATLTRQNSTFTPTTFWLSWRMCGEGLQDDKIEDLQYEMKQAAYDFIRLVDLGGNIPLHLTRPPTFLNISGFPAIQVLVLAYVPSGQKGSTVELILQPEFGLLKELLKHREPTRHFRRFFRGLVAHYVRQGNSVQQAQVDARAFALHALDNVHVVDESQAGNVTEGKVPKGMKLNFIPNFDEEPGGHGTSSSGGGGGGGGGGGSGPPPNPFDRLGPPTPAPLDGGGAAGAIPSPGSSSFNSDDLVHRPPTHGQAPPGYDPEHPSQPPTRPQAPPPGGSAGQDQPAPMPPAGPGWSPGNPVMSGQPQPGQPLPHAPGRVPGYGSRILPSPTNIARPGDPPRPRPPAPQPLNIPPQWSNNPQSPDVQAALAAQQQQQQQFYQQQQQPASAGGISGPGSRPSPVSGQEYQLRVPGPGPGHGHPAPSPVYPNGRSPSPGRGGIARPGTPKKAERVGFSPGPKDGFGPPSPFIPGRISTHDAAPPRNPPRPPGSRPVSNVPESRPYNPVSEADLRRADRQARLQADQRIAQNKAAVNEAEALETPAEREARMRREGPILDELRRRRRASQGVSPVSRPGPPPSAGGRGNYQSPTVQDVNDDEDVPIVHSALTNANAERRYSGGRDTT